MQEINLKVMIQILLKNSRILISIISIVLVVALIVNLYVLEPIFEAKVILMASGAGAKPQTTQQNQVQTLLDNLSQYPQMTIKTYKEQINNPQILEQTIKELDLGKLGITRPILRDMLSLNTIDETNLITISVRYPDRKISADIANTIAKKFTSFVSEKAKDQATKSLNYISQQINIEKQNLDKVLLEYKEYLAQPRGLSELKKEVDSKLDLMTQYKTRIVDLGLMEQAIRQALSAAKNQLSVTPDRIVLKKSLLEDPILSKVASEGTGKSINELFKANVESEEINQANVSLNQSINGLEIELAKTIAEKNKIDNEIKKLQTDLEKLQLELADRTYLDTIIQQKLNFSQAAYQTFVNKYEELRIIKSSDIGDASIIIISPALEPLIPVGPNKKLNMIVSGILAILLSIFAILFKEYWNRTVVLDAKKSTPVQ